MVTCDFITGNGSVKMSTLIIRMLREAQVKEGPTGFNYHNHWKISKNTKIHKSLYKHINQAVKSMLHLPIVSLRQLKQQLRNDDYLRQSILKSSTSGYNGKVLSTANPDAQLRNNIYTPLLQPIYKLIMFRQECTDRVLIKRTFVVKMILLVKNMMNLFNLI